MSKSTLRASASPFAHLIPGFLAAKSDDKDMKGRKAEDEKPKKDDEDEDTKAKKTAEESEPDEDTGIDEGDKPDLVDVVDPDDSIDEDAAPEEDDSDPKVRKAAKSGRKAERARWTKVMGSKAADGRVAAACQLLSTTTASAASVIGTLAALPAVEAPAASGGRGRLDERMASRPGPKVGQDAPAAGGDFAAQSAAAMAKVRSARR